MKEISCLKIKDTKNDIICEVKREKDSAVFVKTFPTKKLFSKNQEKKHLNINYLRNFDILLRDVDFETFTAEKEHLLTVEVEGKTFSTSNQSELRDDILRYFEACFEGKAQPEKLSFSSFDGGGPEYSLKMEKTGVLTWYGQRVYGNPDHDKMCGSAFDIIYEFYPLREGEASAVLTASSPICPEPDRRISAVVDRDLKISLKVEFLEDDPRRIK